MLDLNQAYRYLLGKYLAVWFFLLLNLSGTSIFERKRHDTGCEIAGRNIVDSIRSQEGGFMEEWIRYGENAMRFGRECRCRELLCVVFLCVLQPSVTGTMDNTKLGQQKEEHR